MMKCSRKVVVPCSRHRWNIIAAGDDEVDDIGIGDNSRLLGSFPRLFPVVQETCCSRNRWSTDTLSLFVASERKKG